MHRLLYPVLFAGSHLGTRFLGLDVTAKGFERLGRGLKKAGLVGKRTPGEIRKLVDKGYGSLPIPVRCLDQAMVTWHLLNLHEHPATLKIGITLAPFQSHAWVELGTEKFVDFVYIPDMEVVAEFPGWAG